MPTFWIICCWRAETGELLQRLLLQRTNEDFQASRWHKTDRIFYCCRGFFLLVCLMGWDTQVWFVCIRSCSEESQVRMSMNLDRELRFGFLGFVFIFFLLFLFFLWVSDLIFSIKVSVLFFLFLGEQTHRAIFLKEWPSTCQCLKGAFLLTCQHLVKSFCFYILY